MLFRLVSFFLFYFRRITNPAEREFATAIEKAIDHIVDTPQIFAIRYKKNRIAHPKVFPYNIHFYIDESNTTVVITAIVHSKRHPKIAKKEF